tara:strand:- start:452 stop:1051 length:600 start_codon:yes stop_codon:yes gene_type:complete
MDRKTYLQISIIFLIIFIMIYIYVDYFRNSNKNIVEVNELDPKLNIVKGTEDLITEMSYFSEDNKGNTYEIKSEYGVINPDNSNLILMDKVKAIIYLVDGEKILINSEKAQYNDNNNDTIFKGSVEMIYIDHKINSENMDLSFNDKTVILYDNVRYNSSISNITADRIFVDLLNKNTKIQMNDDNSNILVRSIINSGNN